MTNLTKIIEDTDFRVRFHREVQDLFEELTIKGEIQPYIIELDKRITVIENGMCKRNEKGKLVFNTIKGTSLTTLAEWEKEYGKFEKKGMYNSHLLMQTLLLYHIKNSTAYNFKLEFHIPDRMEDTSTTFKEYFQLEKLSYDYNIHKFSIASGKDNFGFQNRVIVPEEMVTARISMNYEENIKFGKGANTFQGAQGQIIGLKGQLKIEGEKDNLIKKVYDLVKDKK